MVDSRDQRGEKNPMWGKPSWNKGMKGFIHKGSFRKGHKKFADSNAWKAGEHSSPKTEFKKGHVISNVVRLKMRATHKRIGTRPPINIRYGAKNNFWKGGVTSLYNQIRGSFKYRQWRSDIFTRDKFQCIFGGKKHGWELHADHIKQMALIVKENKIKTLKEAMECNELWDINNGRTLCVPCHKKTDTYLKRWF